MQLYLNKTEQIHYTAKQLSCFFPCRNEKETREEIATYIDSAYERLEYCFSRISIKYYHKNENVFFSPLITDQYATFLYFLANSIAVKSDNKELADRLYALNKALHGLDVYYEVKLPQIFLLVHTVGTVLGRAHYEDYLVVYQGVTVGGNLKLEYPTIGKEVGLFANSKIIGNVIIEDRAMISAGALLMDSKVPAQHVCFGTHPNTQCKPLKKSITKHYFQGKNEN